MELHSAGSEKPAAHVKQAVKAEELAKIEDLQSEIEALRRERDEAKRLAREALERAPIVEGK